MIGRGLKEALAGLKGILSIFRSRQIIVTICTALAVIAMVVLLTITINHAREQKIIQLFSEQQAKLCRSLSFAEASLFKQTKNAFKAFTQGFPTGQVAREKAIGEFYKTNSHLLADIALISPNGGIIIRASQALTSDEDGFLYKGNDEFVSARGDVFLVLRAPLKDGSQLATLLSLKNLLSHLHPEQESAIASHILIASSNGSTLAQIPEDKKRIFVPETVAALIQAHLSRPESQLLDAPPSIRYEKEGKKRTAIAAVHRIDENKGAPFLIIFTDQNAIIAAARTAFFNNMAGVAFLVLVLILSAIVVIYNVHHRLLLQQQIENLRLTKEWEKQLEAEKKTAEGIVEGLPIPAFVIDKEHKIIFWNKACEDLTGYSRAEMLGTSRQYEPFYGKERPRPVIADLIVNNRFDVLNKLYGKKKIRPSPMITNAYEARDRFQNLNGKTRHLFFIAAPINDDEGNIIAAIETLQDVTAAVEANKQLSEYAESLENEVANNIAIRREMETLYNYLSSIVKSLPDALFDVNEDGTINNIIRNDRDEAWSESHRGKHIRELVPVALREELLARWEAVKKGEMVSCELEVPYQHFPTKNFFITCNPVVGANRYVIIRRDVTEMKSLEKRFYESQRLAALGCLATGIAHEVRNPLSSIKMSLQILRKRLEPTGNDLKRMDIALSEVAHLENLVSDILIYAKPAEPNKKLIYINKVLEDALVLQESALVAKKISIKKALADSLPLAALDEGMMMQVFLNLYRNAIEAMVDGGELGIKTRLATNDSIYVEVADNGKGIDNANMAHIFDPFFTADKPYGTGLGLTQVRRLLELHDGEIGIASTPGVGTTIVITLPV